MKLLELLSFELTDLIIVSIVSYDSRDNDRIFGAYFPCCSGINWLLCAHCGAASSGKKNRLIVYDPYVFAKSECSVMLYVSAGQLPW